MLVGAFFWSFFPIITVLSYAHLPSIVSLAYSTLLSVIFFAAFVTYRKSWHEIRNALLWKYCLYVAMFICVLFYSFFFIGLTKTTAGNAGLISLFEIFTSFLFFNVFKKEVIPREYKIGALCMVVGAGIVLSSGFGKVNMGDILIFIATFFAPIGNYFQQKARMIASSEMIMLLRSLISFPIIFLLAYIMQQSATLEMLKSSWLVLFVNGFLILGFLKVFWIESIHRISVTKAASLESITPFFTLIFAWLILKQAPHVWQFASLVPLLLGVLLLTDNFKFKKHDPFH